MATTVTDAALAGSPVSALPAGRPRGVAVPPTSPPATPRGYDAVPVALMTAAAATTGTTV